MRGEHGTCSALCTVVLSFSCAKLLSHTNRNRSLHSAGVGTSLKSFVNPKPRYVFSMAASFCCTDSRQCSSRIKITGYLEDAQGRRMSQERGVG